MNSGKANILLGVSGGIAAYKSCELARLLVRDGADVRVVFTTAAGRFVTPLAFQALTGNPVRSDLFDEAHEAAMGHIELARWADQVIVAPATADFLARLAQGRANDLLTTICLASEAPLYVAPAMNHRMWRHPATSRNVQWLRGQGVTFIGPEEGPQACGETGPGRMAEPEEIFALLRRRKGLFSGQKVTVTAGPTREPVDPVRYLGNRSSGKMGYSLARAFVREGAEVILVSGPVVLSPPPGVSFVGVETALQMREAVMDSVVGQDIFAACAAVADYRPQEARPHKIKKSSNLRSLPLVRNPDILAEVAALEGGPWTLGFAAETEELEVHARAKLEAKGVDMIAANLVGRGLGFESEDNALEVFWRGGHQSLKPKRKERLAEELVRLVARVRSGQELVD